jgi:hypothetical protein
MPESCSAVFVATNFIVGRCTASAIASASRKSFFCPFEYPQRLSSTAHLGPAQEFIQITRGFRLAEIEALNFSAVHITKLS